MVLTIDPETGSVIDIIDEYSEYLVGIASCYGDPYMGNCVYVIQNDGVVVQEVYIDAGMLIEGYEGIVIPFYATMYGEHMGMETGYDVGDTFYFNSAYYDNETSMLFWSAFNYEADDTDVELLAIDADYTQNVYSLGTFAPTVWPVGGLYEANDYDYAYTEGSRLTEEDIMALRGKVTVRDIQLVEKIEVKKANTATLQPMSGAASVTNKEETVTVNVTAGAAANNGVFTATFDTAALELLNVNVLGDCISVNRGEGTVTIGFVNLEGVADDAIVATLIFKAKSTENTTVTIVTKELNNTAPATSESVDVTYEHTNTEVVGAKDATCTEDGYTGDIHCADCGKLLASGEVIEAAGHGATVIKDAADASCTVNGYEGDGYCSVCGDKVSKGESINANGHGKTEVRGAKDATCTKDGYTGDTYCTDCGEKVATGEVIPATNHAHTEVKDAKAATCTKDGYTGDTYCTDCGEKVADGKVVEATGHGDTEVKGAKPATTEKEGYTGDTYCADCGEKVADGEVIPVVESDEIPVTGEATHLVLMAVIAILTVAATGMVVINRKKLF